MIFIKQRVWEELLQIVIPDPNDFERITNDICEGAVTDAKSRLHPLLRSVELDRLDRRSEFLQAFKLALEQRIAQHLVSWQPNVKAVYEFVEPCKSEKECWDSSIHLLVMVPKPLNTMKAFVQLLDQNLVKHLKQLSWPRFRTCQSILEVQHVTPDEVRRGLSYGAMFYALYTAPVKIWPQNESLCGLKIK